LLPINIDIQIYIKSSIAHFNNAEKSKDILKILYPFLIHICNVCRVLFDDVSMRAYFKEIRHIQAMKSNGSPRIVT